MNSNHDPQAARARADLGRFLAACYYEPSAAFVEERMFDSMIDAAGRVDPELATRARALAWAFAENTLQELLVDYTRLFIGPVDAPARPYGSVWLERERALMQASTLDVVALYEEGGFRLADDVHDLPDHVAVELEFLYVLLFREAQARLEGNGDALRRAGDLKRRFLASHLGRWLDAFTDACAAAAQTRFYRELAVLTAAYVKRAGNAAS